MKSCSFGCLWAAACAPAFIDHHTIMPCAPESTRREIWGEIFSSGRFFSASKPVIAGMASSCGDGA